MTCRYYYFASEPITLIHLVGEREMMRECRRHFSDEGPQGGNCSVLPGYLHYQLGNQTDITHTLTHTLVLILQVHNYQFNTPAGAL